MKISARNILKGRITRAAQSRNGGVLLAVVAVRYTHVGYEQTRQTAEELSSVLDI